MPHCVEGGRGIPRFFCNTPSRLKGRPLPYFSRAIMLPALASYFFWPTPSGASAVNTSPQQLHRSFWSSQTHACTGACAREGTAQASPSAPSHQINNALG